MQRGAGELPARSALRPDGSPEGVPMYGTRLQSLQAKLSEAERLAASLPLEDRAPVQRMIDLVRERIEVLRVLTSLKTPRKRRKPTKRLTQ